MNWGAVMICWQANSNLKSSLYTKAPSYNTRNDCICHHIFAPLSVPFYPTKTIVHCLKWQFSLFFHLSIMVGKQKILDLEGLWIYIFRFQIKRKQQKLAGFRARSVVGSEYSEYKNNCWCATGSKLVQFAGNHSQHGQRSWVSDEIKTSTEKSFLPDEFLTSPWIVKWAPPLLTLSGLIIPLRKKFLREKAKVCTLWDLCSRRWSLNLKTITAKLWQIWFVRSKSWFAEKFVITVSQ